VSDDAGGSNSKLTKTVTATIINKAIFSLIIPIVAYIALQTVSRPYYTLGKLIYVETNCYQTVFVVNPGPWKTRNPKIEFFSGAGVSVVDFSPDVSVTTVGNKQTAGMDNGKQCKESPTIDLDITMYLLILVGICSAIVAVLSTLECLDTKKELRNERASNINQALSALIDRCNAQADVSDSIHTLVSFVAGKGVDIKAQPIKKTSGNGKQKAAKPAD
jgi:hypothetical protein